MRGLSSSLLAVAATRLLLMCVPSGCLAQPDSRLEESLARYLRTFDADRSTRYVAAFYDLSGGGKPDGIVYLVGRKWCGSGGCNTLVLAQSGNTWRIVSNQAITWPPIRVLEATSHGWHDISVWVRGGGVRPGYEADLRFDGETYRESPAPGRGASNTQAPGEVMIPSAEGAKLIHP
jgi:hypothetical protein